MVSTWPVQVWMEWYQFGTIPAGLLLAGLCVCACVCVSVQYITTLGLRYRNESGVGITSLEWYPDTNGTDSESESRRGLYFADKEGYIGWFQGAEPGGGGEGVKGACGDSGDPLAEDSLLMEGIPPDAIFGIDDIMDDDHLLDGNDVGNQQTSGSHGNRGVASEEGDDGIGQSRKRRRLLQESDSDGEADSVVGKGLKLVCVCVLFVTI